MTMLAKAAAHWRGSFGGVIWFGFRLRAVVEASASTASIARLVVRMVLVLRCAAILWLSVIFLQRLLFALRFLRVAREASMTPRYKYPGGPYPGNTVTYGKSSVTSKPLPYQT